MINFALATTGATHEYANQGPCRGVGSVAFKRLQFNNIGALERYESVLSGIRSKEIFLI